MLKKNVFRIFFAVSSYVLHFKAFIFIYIYCSKLAVCHILFYEHTLKWLFVRTTDARVNSNMILVKQQTVHSYGLNS